VIGFTLEEQAMTPRPGTDRGKRNPERLRDALARGAYPHLTEALPYLIDTDFEARFHHKKNASFSDPIQPKGIDRVQ
jgi:TetR/AcrR family tetracycline transcriptional repressor